MKLTNSYPADINADEIPKLKILIVKPGVLQMKAQNSVDTTSMNSLPLTFGVLRAIASRTPVISFDWVS